jgi:hypothetical protein
MNSASLLVPTNLSKGFCIFAVSGRVRSLAALRDFLSSQQERSFSGNGLPIILVKLSFFYFPFIGNFVFILLLIALYLLRV